MTIINRTTGPVDLTLHYTLSSGADSPDFVMTVQAGATQQMSGPFGGGGQCVTADLVATQNGRTIATVENPCEGSRWEIDPEAASPS